MTTYLTNLIDGSRWAVVPVKATEEMCTAHEMADIEDSLRDAHAYQSESWDVMLAAAPEFNVDVMVEKVADELLKALTDMRFQGAGDHWKTEMRYAARAALSLFEVK